MSYAELFERSPMRIFERSTNGGLANGQLGAIIGRAGVGKSALLVHVALDRLFRDQKVLHVSLREGAEHVRTFYSEIFEGIARVSRLKGPDRDRALVKIEKGRLVQCYLDRGFGAADLDKAISFTADVMHFVPDLVVVCVAAALRRGIKDEVLAPGFRISGLGQLVDAGIKADRTVTFGD